MEEPKRYPAAPRTALDVAKAIGSLLAAIPLALLLVAVDRTRQLWRIAEKETRPR